MKFVYFSLLLLALAGCGNPVISVPVVPAIIRVVPALASPTVAPTATMAAASPTVRATPSLFVGGETIVISRGSVANFESGTVSRLTL